MSRAHGVLGSVSNGDRSGIALAKCESVQHKLAQCESLVIRRSQVEIVVWFVRGKVNVCGPL